MTPDAAKNMLVDTDYPLDQVILLTQQPIVMGGGIDVRIPHGLPFIPLVWFQWSLSADFSVAYENNTGSFPSGNSGYIFALQVTIEADATNITIRGNGIVTSIPVYIRVFGFEPSTYNVDLAAVSSQGDQFVIDSDYNYMKLFMNARTPIIAGGATSTITHNLNAYPHTLLWFESTAGTIYPMNLSWPLVNINAELTPTQMIIRNDSFSDAYVHYRIYLDE